MHFVALLLICALLLIWIFCLFRSVRLSELFSWPAAGTSCAPAQNTSWGFFPCHLWRSHASQFPIGMGQLSPALMESSRVAIGTPGCETYSQRPQTPHSHSFFCERICSNFVRIEAGAQRCIAALQRAPHSPNPSICVKAAKKQQMALAFASTFPLSLPLRWRWWLSSFLQCFFCVSAGLYPNALNYTLHSLNAMGWSPFKKKTT